MNLSWFTRHLLSCLVVTGFSWHSAASSFSEEKVANLATLSTTGSYLLADNKSREQTQFLVVKNNRLNDTQYQLELALEKMIQIAISYDPLIQGSHYQQQSTNAMAVAASSESDPNFSVSAANLPVDSFDFSQEAMTQLKVGISQQFSRGNSLTLKQRQLELFGEQYAFQIEQRKKLIAKNVGQLWLDNYLAREKIHLINSNRSLFEQLVEVSQARYSSVIGKTRQQDVVRAQLELIRLDDRLTTIKQSHDTAQEELLKWTTPSVFIGERKNDEVGNLKEAMEKNHTLPKFNLIKPYNDLDKKLNNDYELFELLSKTPEMKLIEPIIAARNMEIDIAKQNYKPQWGVNASYGFRDDSTTGLNRPDFFSIGITFDLPLFTGNKQDQQVKSAIAMSSREKTNKWLVARNLIVKLKSELKKLKRLNERSLLYKNRLMSQMQQQSEAALTAYTHGDGDFSEVVRARIAQLDTEIDQKVILVERAKSLISLNYLLATKFNEIVVFSRERIGNE